MFSPSSVILDCGSSRTALGVFQIARGRLRCVTVAQEKFATPAENETQWLESTRAALRALRPRIPVTRPVGLVIPGHLTLLKLVPAPEAARRHWSQILRFATEQHFPQARDEVVWDGARVGAHDQVHELLLVAAKLEVIEPLCALVQEAGFSPQLVLPSPLATLASYRLTGPGASASTVVLNLGARSTNLLLLGSGIRAVRTLSIGTHQRTPALAAHGAGVGGKTDEQKLAPGDPGQREDATEVLATRLTQEVGRTLDHFARQHESARPDRVILTGGGARLNGLRSALTARLKLPVELLSLDPVIDFSDRPEPPAAGAELLELSDLIGAAATQLRPDLPQANLLPPRRCREARYRRRRPWLLASALLLVAALIPPMLHERRLTLVARAQLAGLEPALVPLRMQAENNAANLRQIAVCRREVARLQTLAVHRTSWLGLLADLQAGLGQVQDAWLDSLQVIPAPLTAPLQLKLKGRMLNRPAPTAPAGTGNASRLRALLQAIDRLPGLTVAPKGRHFDRTQPGIIQFDFIVLVDPTHPL